MLKNQPLAEVFGMLIDNNSPKACRHRNFGLCPYNNRIPNCTKDRTNDPLAICSIFEKEKPTIICPIRFREDWKIIENAAKLFFKEGTKWTTVTDVKMYDKFNTFIDTLEFVLVSFDDSGKIIDFVTLDAQAAFVNRDIRKNFNAFRIDSEKYFQKKSDSPSFADYTSTIHYKIAPQLIYRGSILHAWGKKMAFTIDSGLLSKLPVFSEVDAKSAEIVWFVYDLVYKQETMSFELELQKTLYTLLEPTLFQITKVEAGDLEDFVAEVQSRLDSHLDKGYPPTAPTLTDIVSTE